MLGKNLILLRLTFKLCRGDQIVLQSGAGFSPPLTCHPSEGCFLVFFVSRGFFTLAGGNLNYSRNCKSPKAVLPAPLGWVCPYLSSFPFRRARISTQLRTQGGPTSDLQNSVSVKSSLVGLPELPSLNLEIAWPRLDSPCLQCRLGTLSRWTSGTTVGLACLFSFPQGSNVWDLLSQIFFICFVLFLSCLRQETESSFYHSIMTESEHLKV